MWRCTHSKPSVCTTTTCPNAGKATLQPLGDVLRTHQAAHVRHTGRHIADQFGAVGKQARDDVVDVIDGEHDAADPEFVHRSVLGPSSDRFRRVELVQLDPSVAIRCAHQREGSTDVLKANETIYGGALDGRLALQLESEFEKEGLRGFKVVDDDEDIVHSFKRHILPFPSLTGDAAR